MKTKFKPPTEGSRKRKVFETWFRRGPKAAFLLGVKLKLKDSTVYTWISYWAHNAKSKAKARPVAAH